MKLFSSRLSARQSPWATAVVSLLPIAGGLLLFGGPSHMPLRPQAALAQSSVLTPRLPAQLSEPQFPNTPTPEGNVLLANLHFSPLASADFSPFSPWLKVAYKDGTVTVTDHVKSAADESAAETAVVWSGPVTEAVFTEESQGGVHTFTDANGSVLWSNAAGLANPDLLFEKLENGQARLTNKAGAVLWSGPLPRTLQGGYSSQSGSDRMSIVMPGVRVDGINGVYRVSAGKLLWSGRLPPSPLIILRDGHTFTVEGPNGSESGSDQTYQISMTAGVERVTIADTKGRVLGTQTVDALTVYAIGPSPLGLQSPLNRKAQEGQLDAVGTLLLTYRDSAGRVVQRSKVYRDAGGGSGYYSSF